MDLSLAIVIPTRNRPQMARRAIRSAIKELPAEGHILVSDNSDLASDAEPELQAFVESVRDPRVQYVRPPEGLNMPAHWEWAFAQLEASSYTHATVLTDRMVYRPNGLPRVLGSVDRRPDVIHSFNHDAILDANRPVRLISQRWTGQEIRVSSKDLLGLVANQVTHAALPRMLNSIAPRQAIDSMRETFGAVFESVAPDFHFAFHVLSLYPEIVFVDYSVLLHMDQGRSNGASQTTGRASPDHADFVSHLQGGGVCPHAPIPEIETVTNTVMSEYVHASSSVSDPTIFPPIDWNKYLRCLDSELAQMEASPRRDEMRERLAAVAPVSAPRYSRVRRISVGFKRLRRLFGQAFRATIAVCIPRWLWSAGPIAPPTTRFLKFPDQTSALRFSVRTGRSRSRGTSELNRLITDHDVE